jgi:hypothetical protein
MQGIWNTVEAGLIIVGVGFLLLGISKLLGALNAKKQAQ